ncbi:hypothetical protein VULLAG_LOCUS2796 [Vulpes lagopus]
MLSEEHQGPAASCRGWCSLPLCGDLGLQVKSAQSPAQPCGLGLSRDRHPRWAADTGSPPVTAVSDPPAR